MTLTEMQLMAAFVIVLAFYLGRRSVRRPVAVPRPRPQPAARPSSSRPRHRHWSAGLPSLIETDADDALSVSKPMVSYVDELGPRRNGARLMLETAGAAFRELPNAEENPYLAIDDVDWSLLAVADGLGTHRGPRVSRLVVASLLRAFRAESLPWPTENGRPEVSRHLVGAIEQVNQVVCDKASSDPKLHGLASSIVAALFLVDEGQVCIAHVGDGRAYRLRRGKCDLLTADHTLAAKGVTGPLSTQLYRALGMRPTVKVDLVVASIEPDDVYLLCTEAIAKALREDVIAELLERDEDPGVAVTGLLEAEDVDRANAAVVLARVHRRSKTLTTPVTLRVGAGG